MKSGGGNGTRWPISNRFSLHARSGALPRIAIGRRPDFTLRAVLGLAYLHAMGVSRGTIVLGSRSPRRRELLATVVAADRIQILPPRSAEEAGFDGADAWPAIEKRLAGIARGKYEDVLGQLVERTGCSREADLQDVAAVIAADTVIVASASEGRLVVLGQPPARDDWADVVRRWFREYYFGKSHTAATAVCVAVPGKSRVERIIRTEVTFRSDRERWLDWYLSTEEPRGKAGGYAIQEAGSIFVERIEGSPSNVVGLPLETVLEVLAELNVDVD